MSDTFLVINRSATAEIKVKGSRFLAEALPVTSTAEAEDEIAAIRKRAYDATHHCTAYRIGPSGEIFRFNDDGEPSGTAGAPILRQIDGRGLTDTLVVVTRYYGGTKLGTGGLIRAYGDAAAEVLDIAPVRRHVIRVPVRLCFGYPDTSPAMHTVSRFDTEIQETRYTEETEMIVGLRRSEVDAFVEAFVEALAGRGVAEVLPA